MAADIEYDLDEEDCAWLELVNEQRSEEGFAAVKLENLQLLMDRLEKESFFQVSCQLMECAIIYDRAISLH